MTRLMNKKYILEIVFDQEFEIKAQESCVQDYLSSQTSPIRDPRWDFLLSTYSYNPCAHTKGKGFELKNLPPLTA